MKFSKLGDVISDRGVRKTAIARALGISERALRYKMEGKSPFSWEQVCTIQERFFPDIDLKTLFGKEFTDRPA